MASMDDCAVNIKVTVGDDGAIIMSAKMDAIKFIFI